MQILSQQLLSVMIFDKFWDKLQNNQFLEVGIYFFSNFGAGIFMWPLLLQEIKEIKIFKSKGNTTKKKTKY
jgi:hypothetical protein